MASVPRLVGVGSRRENEHVPIHHRPTEEKIAVDWDPTAVPAVATIRSAQVRIWTILSRTFGSSYQRLRILAPPKLTRLGKAKKNLSQSDWENIVRS